MTRVPGRSSRVVTLKRHGSVIAVGCLLLAAAIWARTSAQEHGQPREFTVEGSQFAFSPARLEAQRNDLVKVTFTAHDMAHSFTIDDYRIAKRAGAGQSIVFEFRADRAGTFTFYCNLSQDDRCRQMRGELVVR